MLELLIIVEQGLIEKINIPQRCNEFHVEQQAGYKLLHTVKSCVTYAVLLTLIGKKYILLHFWLDDQTPDIAQKNI